MTGTRRFSLLGLAARWAGLVGFVLFVCSFALAMLILDQRGPLIHLANRVGKAGWYLSLLCFAVNGLAVLVLAAVHRQPARNFPSLYCTFIAPEERTDLFPCVQPSA